MQRVAIIGSSGAGKSTVARQMGAILGIEVIHLDALYWQRGWIATPADAWRARMAELVHADRWILDGNYGATMDLRLAAADTVVFLDFPRRTCLRRAVARWAVSRGRSRPDMAPGCPERLTWDFLRWIWSYPHKGRIRVLRALDQFAGGAQIITLRNDRDVRAFLRGLA